MAAENIGQYSMEQLAAAVETARAQVQNNPKAAEALPLLEAELERVKSLKMSEPLYQPQSGGESLYYNLRPAFQTAGGLIGGAVGGATGIPTAGAASPGLALLGGGLGASGGDFLWQSGRDLGKSMGWLPPEFPAEASGAEQVQAGLRAGAEDVMYGGGAMAGLEALRRGGGWAGKRMLGLNDDAMAEAAKARHFDINPIPSDVSRGGISKIYAKAIGRMPGFSGIFQYAAGKKGEEISNAAARVLDALGPHTTRTEVSERMFKAGKTRFKWFTRQAGNKYNGWRAAASKAGAAFDASSVRATAAEVSDRRFKSRPFLRGPEPTVGEIPVDRGALGMPVETAQRTRMKPVATEGNAQVDDFLLKLRLLDDKMTFEQADWVLDQAQALARAPGLSDANKAVMKKIMGQLNQSFRASPIGAELKEIDAWYANTKRLLERPTAQQFGKVNKTQWGAGFDAPGNINPDELFKVAFNDGSPMAMKDLRKIIGQKRMHEALRVHVSEALESARRFNPQPGQKPFDVPTFLNKLGIMQEGSAQWKALSEALRGSKITPQALRGFAEAVEIGMRTEAPDAATMIARRAALSGAKGITNAFKQSPGVAALGTIGWTDPGLVATLVAFAGMRGLTRRVFASSKYTDLFRKAFDDRLPKRVRQQNYGRLMEGLFQQLGDNAGDLGVDYEGTTYRMPGGDATRASGPSAPEGAARMLFNSIGGP